METDQYRLKVLIDILICLVDEELVVQKALMDWTPGEAVDYVKTDLMPDFDFDAFNHEYPEGNEEGGAVEETAPEVVATTSIEEEIATPVASDNISTTHSEEVDKW